MSNQGKFKLQLKWEDIFTDLLELYQSVFKYENLPDSISERYIENSLMYGNQVTFYKQKDVDLFICLKSSNVNLVNIYGDPRQTFVSSKNGFTEYVNIPNDGLVIYDNRTRVPPIRKLKDYAMRIANCDLTIDVNIHQQKTPRLWEVGEKNKNTVKQLINRVNSYVSDVLINLGAMEEKNGKTSVHLAPAPFIADKTRIEKNQLYSEIYSFMGIDSQFSEKQERLVADEVEASSGATSAKLGSRFRERQIAVDKINKKFGLNIEVKINKEEIKRLIESSGGGDPVE